MSVEKCKLDLYQQDQRALSGYASSKYLYLIYLGDFHYLSKRSSIVRLWYLIGMEILKMLFSSRIPGGTHRFRGRA